MREYELEVLEQYPFEVSSTRKTRGAYFCETNQGICLFETLNYSSERVSLVQKLQKQLMDAGILELDTLIATKEGKYYSQGKDGTKYIVKRWFTGRECEVRKEGDVLTAVQNLAKLHCSLVWEQIEPLKPDCVEAGAALSEPRVIEPFSGQNLLNEYSRHNQELKKIRQYIRRRVTKNEFEQLYLQNCTQMIDEAQRVTKRLTASDYETLFCNAIRENKLVHGDYNYHNVLLLTPGIATTNFQHFHKDIQMADLYYFIRKVMEKNRWNISLGVRMMRSYEAIRPISDEEREYLAIRLAYPEKFWKIMNTYYHSNKAWIPEKNLDKLKIALLQRTDIAHYLEQVFGYST